MAVVLDKRAAKTADKIQFDGDRVLMERSRGKLTNSVLVRVHMPTSHHDDEETDEMHDKIEELLETETKGKDYRLKINMWVTMDYAHLCKWERIL